MKRLREQIALPTNIPWSETQSITSSKPVVVADPDDDLTREVAFYDQALEAAVLGRERIKKEGGVFERPDDYFAEMIKTDDHMAKIRQRLLDENASIQASERAKAQRDLKKFGKKVQTEKRLEREKSKADALDKIQALKKSTCFLFTLVIHINSFKWLYYERHFSNPHTLFMLILHNRAPGQRQHNKRR